ncbi:MAG TPA: type IX secretion system protein PorQ [Flavisolibacter sp.]|jgi:hypothetical protein|nr:type IX secretion system protein PorQ [Flavisolibacter sp.]
MKWKFCLVVIIFYAYPAASQTLGGNAAFNFLKLAFAPGQASAGGINVSYQSNDLTFSYGNPSLLKPGMNAQLATGITFYPGAIKSYTFSGSLNCEKIKTSLATHIFYVNYGSIPQTDASGMNLGLFKPSDYVVQVSASRSYLERWRYGLSLKFIQSNLGTYKASGIAADFGLNYRDSGKGYSISFVARNMGIQLQKYADEQEELPFDLQVGFSKRLVSAPFAFSITGQHMHRFDIRYDDTEFNSQELNSESHTNIQKALNHIVVATHLFMGSHLEATIGYNALQRFELRTTSGGNGLTGFSAGLKIKYKGIQINYARQSYQRNIAANSIGINLASDQLGFYLK